MPANNLSETDPNSLPAMQVIFTPTWPKNPYHAQIISHLIKQNVEVLPDTSMRELLQKKARGEKVADIVHLHTLSKFEYSLGMITRLILLISRIRRLRSKGVKVVMTVHDLFPHETILPKADLFIGRTMARIMDVLFVHSLSAKTKLIKTWKLKDTSVIKITPHPNFIDCYPNTVSRLQARSQLSLQEHHIVFLFLGQIRPYKGIDELLDGFSLTKNDRYRLLIVGEPWTQQLGEQLAKRCEKDNRVQLINGFVSSDKIQIYMNACDVVILPYRRAFTSGAAVLAMSFAKPCIATNIDSFPDVLDKNGAFFCETEKPSSIAEAMHSAAASETNLKEMGQYNFDRASKWKWEEMAEILASNYRTVTKAQQY